ncbi:hypothetical protein BDK51DRAFT_42667 [Blyttiomyces helicus]|uniref:Uncharacterized protein n=1 Tax=Blyttiomyces helicus TaxID=388810 RepID=A0A4P9W6X9_9FUNG|nr:hypothetical protein BDK51DRAFT_42667 [Blyttiomyces helicus]|eukprot:RKO87143.1 hypothetical protein BDK51DRAFT_42667 [Blyttiomyces helicus]
MDAGLRGDCRTSAKTLRAGYEEAGSEMRFLTLSGFVFVFGITERGGAASALMWRQGDLKAAVERFRRGIAISDSATESYRRTPIMHVPDHSLTGEVIDKYLDDMRINLKGFSYVRPPIHRLHNFTALFRDHYVPLPTAADLLFLRDLLDNSEPPLHRVYCVYTHAHHAAAKSCRLAIALAGSVHAADRLATTILGLSEGVASAKPSSIAPSTFPDRRATCAEHRPGPIASSTVHAARGRHSVRWPAIRPSCRPPRAFAAGDLVRIFGLTSPKHEVLIGTIVELHGPELGGRWRFVHVGSDTILGNAAIIDPDAIVLVVPSNELDQPLQESVA